MMTCAHGKLSILESYDMMDAFNRTCFVRLLKMNDPIAMGNGQKN